MGEAKYLSSHAVIPSTEIKFRSGIKNAVLKSEIREAIFFAHGGRKKIVKFALG